jgi:hypothetical protein
MTTRSIRGGPGLAGCPAVIVTLSLIAALHASPARAEVSDDTEDGWKKVLAFARCAAHVFRAITPVDWTVAFLDCGRLYMEEPPVPGGGQP